MTLPIVPSKRLPLSAVSYETVRGRWKKYQVGVEREDATLVAIACGDVDGRRDNHRIFTREEEALLRTAIDQENVDPNKPVIQRLALSIHSQQQPTFTLQTTHGVIHMQISPFVHLIAS